MGKNLGTYAFVLGLIIIYFVLPVIFPHNEVVYWLRGIFLIVVLVSSKLSLRKNMEAYAFVLIFVIINFVLPAIFPHNEIVYWLSNILNFAIMAALLYDLIRYTKRKKN
ncbi:hypothetical protein ABNF65_18230 [Paenibacillus larvae]